MTDVIAAATEMALHYHAGQVRPNKAKTPKLQHIFEVSDLVRRHGGTDDEIAAAILHDAWEDTLLSRRELRAQTNEHVTFLVDGLTDPPDFEALPLAIRKLRQAERIRGKERGVKLVKIADQTSNLWSVAIDPPLDWFPTTAMEYADGSLLVVNECRGTQDDLEEIYDVGYTSCVKLYSPYDLQAPATLIRPRL